MPVCLLAAVGLADLAQRISGGRRGLRTGIALAVLLASTPTHFYNARRITELVARDPGAYYQTPALRRALRWLGREADRGAVVLAQYATARSIPGSSGQFVSQGHWAQSVDLEEHRRWLAGLFDPRSRATPAEKESALRASRIDYVFIDDEARRKWLLGRLPDWLARSGAIVYDDSGIAILRVDHARP